MKEDENKASYFLDMYQTINALKGLGDTVYEEAIVQKVLRYLPMRFDSKVLVPEDRKDLEKFTWMRSMTSSMPMK